MHNKIISSPETTCSDIQPHLSAEPMKVNDDT